MNYMIDSNIVMKIMEALGFSNVMSNAEFMGEKFQILGEGKAGLQKQKVLISSITALDADAALNLAEIMNKVDNKSRSLWIGKLFTYCIFVDKLDTNARALLFDRFIENRRKASNLAKGGGGGLVVVDMENKKVDSNIPRIYGIQIISDLIKEVLNHP